MGTLTPQKRIALEEAIRLVLARRGLLSGYDKARHPGKTRQGREIAQARKLLTAHEKAERRKRRRH